MTMVQIQDLISTLSEPTSQTMPSVAVIGAGPAGLAAAYRLMNMVPDVRLTIYERYDRVGGQFNVREKAGIDEDGLPVHSAAWPGMYTNSVGRSLEYSTYPMDIRPTRFLPSDTIQKYVEGYSDSHGLTPLIKFCKHVNKAWYDDDLKQFKLRITDLKDKKEDLVTYDYLVVASGRYAVPNIPHFDGEETFPGTIMHSKDFKTSAIFKNKRVLMVGFVSAASILCQTLSDKIEYDHILMIYRNVQNKLLEMCAQHWKYPRFELRRTRIVSIQNSTVHFEDGTSGEYDVILKGTGFKHEVLFLEPDLQVNPEFFGFLNDLYLGVMHRNNNKLFFISQSLNARSASKWELQGIAVAQLISGVLKTPSKEEMQKDVEDRIQSWMNLESKPLGLADKMNEECAYLKKVTRDTTVKDEAMAKILIHDFDLFGRDVADTMQGKTYPELDKLLDE